MARQRCVFSQFLGIFSKQTWLKVLLSSYFIVKNTKLWSFSIKFGELRCKNVSNTFTIKRLKGLSAMRTPYILCSIENPPRNMNVIRYINPVPLYLWSYVLMYFGHNLEVRRGNKLKLYICISIWLN